MRSSATPSAGTPRNAPWKLAGGHNEWIRRMETWKEYKYNELFNWCSGKPFLKEGSKYPVYGSNGIIGYSDISNFENRIILGRVGAYCGSVNYYDKSFYATDNTLVTECDESKITYKYAYYLLTQSKLNSFAGGAAQPLITQSILKHLKCAIPPLPTQQKIASILSTYDNLIQNYKKQIEDLQTCASELYKEWFVRFRFPGYQTAQFENGIPVGWKVEKLGNLANISTGKCNREDAEEDGIYPLFDRSQEIKKSSEWIKDCEAIIVPGEGTSFIPRYYKGKFNLHQRCYCVEPKLQNFGIYLFYVLMLNRKYFLSVATGATVPSLRYNNFASMKFVLPELSLCKKFNTIADSIFNKVDNLNKQITNLTQQRDLLLPRLMSGKLEVK